VNITGRREHPLGAYLTRSITLMVLVAVASIAMLASAAPAQAENPICDRWTVSYRNIQRGYLAGCIFAKFDEGLVVPYVDGGIEVCDHVNEPQETNIVRARVVAAFFNGRDFAYTGSRWYSAPGDGTGCQTYDDLFLAGPRGNVWSAAYVRIDVQAPGKNTEEYWEVFED
jgi:hypothetical protein